MTAQTATIGVPEPVDRGLSGERPAGPSLSPSRAADFKTCPLLFRFRTIDRLPAQPTADQVRGTLVHAVLERLFDLPAAERTPEAAAALVTPQWERLLEEEPGLGELFAASTDGEPAGLFDAVAAPVDVAGPGDFVAIADPSDLGALSGPGDLGALSSPGDLAGVSDPGGFGSAAGQGDLGAVSDPGDLGAVSDLGGPAAAVHGDLDAVSVAGGFAAAAGQGDLGAAAGPGDLATAGPADEVGRLAAFLGGARSLLDGYFAVEDPRRLEPAERESLVSTLVDDELLIRGYIDRLDISPAGDLRVVDYKTGGAPREAFESRALFQLKFYALVLWRTRGVVPRVLRLLYLKDAEVLDYSPDAEELERFERTLVALSQAVERAKQERDFRPKPSRLCGWCSYHEFCPEFGGTIPPYPEPRLEDAAAEVVVPPGGDLLVVRTISAGDIPGDPGMPSQ